MKPERKWADGFRKKSQLVFGGLFLALGLLGCSTPPKARIPEKPGVRLYYQEVPLGFSVEGSFISATIFGEGEDCTFFIGGVHGSEPEGVFLLRCLCDYLKLAPEHFKGKRVVVLALLNPDGLERGTRWNANRIDLNRNFPSKNWGKNVSGERAGPEPVSEPETQVLLQAFNRFRPQKIVTIHSGAACIDYDGPAWRLANAMSAKCGLPVMRLGPRPGSLGSYAGVDLGIPVITLEIGQKMKTEADGTELWKRYRDALLEAIDCPAG